MKKLSSIFLVMLLCVSHAYGQSLAAHLDVSVSSSAWTYSIFNDEAAGSPNFVTSFTLTVAAPITVTSSPAGWDYGTDGSSYVFWYNTDSSSPYPHDVAPGASLSGFSIQSTSSSSALSDVIINSQDHSADVPGPEFDTSILAPAAVPVPESSTLVSLAVGLVVLGGVVLVARRRSRKPAS